MHKMSLCQRFCRTDDVGNRFSAGGYIGGKTGKTLKILGIYGVENLVDNVYNFL